MLVSLKTNRYYIEVHFILFRTLIAAQQINKQIIRTKNLLSVITIIWQSIWNLKYRDYEYGIVYQVYCVP